VRPLIILFAAGFFVSVTATARTSETTITGVVVDSHGRPVSQALVSAGLRGRQFSVSGAERIVIMTDIQAGRDGRFEFTTTEPISNLMITATSSDLKRGGRLEHISKKDNVIVLR